MNSKQIEQIDNAARVLSAVAKEYGLTVCRAPQKTYFQLSYPDREFCNRIRTCNDKYSPYELCTQVRELIAAAINGEFIAQVEAWVEANESMHQTLRNCPENQWWRDGILEMYERLIEEVVPKIKEAIASNPYLRKINEISPKN